MAEPTIHVSTGKYPGAYVCTRETPWNGTPTAYVRHLHPTKLGAIDGIRYSKCHNCGHHFTEEDHLSHSQVELWHTCPAAWDAKENRNVKHPASAATLFGGAWGRMLERFLTERAQGTSAYAPAIWQEEWAKSAEQQIDWKGEAPATYERLGLTLLDLPDTWRVLDGLVPLIEPDRGVAMERYTELRIPGVPIPVIGYIDLISRDRRLFDFKTSSKPWPPSRLNETKQGLLYLASLAQERWELGPLEFTYLVWSKAPPYKVQVLTKQYTGADLFAAMRHVRAMWDGVRAGHFEPRKNWLMCRQGSCGVWATCPKGAGYDPLA